MPNRPLLLFLLALSGTIASATEYHVAISGHNRNNGTAQHPFRTISYAATKVKSGDIITVHAGTYRELVMPATPGVVYCAATGERVEIKGSEVIRGWVKKKPGIWRVSLPNSFFGKYNPYKDLISGDWFFPSKQKLHTGEVYLNNKALNEAENTSKSLTWSCSAESKSTIIYANFGDKDPNQELTEINVRLSCFYPKKTGINCITVSGFYMSQAATQWAAPTAEQVGIIGTNWSKGWVIENNTISDSKCVGITLGKDRASGQNVWSQDPSKDGSVLYNEMIIRVITNGWNKENIGSHIVRNNTIYNCGAAGICGSFGAAYSEITHNHIYDIYTYRPYWGAEMAGIKIHGAIDVMIKGNRIHNTNIGIWLDWMAQGTRVSSNLVYDNDYVDFFPEVNHGPYLVDNNLFLSPFAIKDWSEGGAYAHNLIAGLISRAPQDRATPYFKAHSTKLVAVKPVLGGDNQFYNNIFIGNHGRPYVKPAATYLPPDAIDPNSGYGLSLYNNAALPVEADGNVYMDKASASKGELNIRLAEDFDPAIRLISDSTGLRVNLNLFKLRAGFISKLVSSKLLGRARTTGMPFENPDGSELVIDRDYFGKTRNINNPVAGPFEEVKPGTQTIKIW